MSNATSLVESLRYRGIVDERVLAAIAAVDRARFVAADLADQAWEDRALPIGSEQTISQPYIVALMTEALALTGNETVFEIGTGSGYQAAILAKLCAHVVTIERHADLLVPAREVLAALGIDNISYRVGDGTLGAAELAPFDGVLVTAGAPDVPDVLVRQLAENGRMVIPVGDEHAQELVVIRRTATGLDREYLCDCRFVPLIGEAGWPAGDVEDG